MNSTETIIQQRQKERKALKLFLLSSLVGSLAFHAGVMALKVGDRGGNLPIDPTEEEMEVIVEEASPEQPIQESIAEIEPPSEPDVQDVPEEVAFAPEAAPPQPLAPESPTPLEKGEDAPSDQPATAPEAAQPMTNSTGDTSLKLGGGPLFKPFGLGSGFGNAERPTGFNPLGIPTGDPKGKPGGVPNGDPNGKPGGVPGGNATRTTAPPVSTPKPNKLSCLSCPKPRYRGSESTASVEMKIRPDGSVQVRLRKSSGDPETDRETLETMSKWRYDPKTVPEGGIKKPVKLEYEEAGSARQRRNQERRREKAERRQVAEQEQQRREAQERQRQPPATAIEAPEKPAPASPPTAPSTDKPAVDPAPAPAPAAETLPPPVEPAPPAPAPEAEPAPAPEPAPVEASPPQAP